MSAQCPVDCGGCTCFLSPPCQHCVEHGCPECGEHGCTNDECGKPEEPPPKIHSRLARRMVPLSLLAAMGVMGMGADVPLMNFNDRRRTKSQAKAKNIERNKKAQKAAKKRRKS